MKTEQSRWHLYGTARHYSIWHDGEAFQITEGDKPPGERFGGYYLLAPLLKLKRLAESDFVRAQPSP